MTELNETARIDDLLREYPFLLDFLKRRSPKYAMLGNPILRGTVGKVATLAQVAAIGGIEPRQLTAELAAEIAARTGQGVAIGGEAGTAGHQAKAEALKEIIRDLHRGASPESVKARFAELVKDVDAAEVARMEQQLIAEGMPQEEIKRLCDVHVRVFKDALDRGEMPHVKPGHPIHTYMWENRAAERLMRELETQLGDPSDGKAPRARRDRLAALLEDFSRIDRHYLRKENQLFPLLEARGMSGPSEVMWAIHDDIRASIKKARRELAGEEEAAAAETLRNLLQAARDMIYKEEHILFPMALEVLSGEDWEKVRRGEEEIGFAWVEAEARSEKGEEGSARSEAGGRNEEENGIGREIELRTGRLTPEQVDLLLTHLPVDISFVNEDDEVVYYSQTKERIFPRSPGVIGRRVHNCHPPKSVHVVQKILDAFKAGTKDVAEFYIEMAGRFIHIRYYAVRDGDGKYRGALEVSQDVTAIRGFTGEKRLLDWE